MKQRSAIEIFNIKKLTKWKIGKSTGLKFQIDLHLEKNIDDNVDVNNGWENIKI
jgi:hypothetical protein